MKMAVSKRPLSPKLLFNDENTRYPIVSEVARSLGFLLTSDLKRSKRKKSKQKKQKIIFWHDSGALGTEILAAIKPQLCHKLNHFPGMGQICQKARLARILQRFKVHFPNEFCYHPKTWCLPEDKLALMSYHERHGTRNQSRLSVEMKEGLTFIVKPATGCQGHGIFLTQSVQCFKDDLDGLFDGHVVQEYLKNPLLINGFKFDLRIYALVLSVHPKLRAFVHHKGLVRFCTQTYEQPNADNVHEDFRCMHLTNYAVNKLNENYVQPRACETNRDDNKDGVFHPSDGDSSKWSLERLFQYLLTQRIDGHLITSTRIEVLWKQIKDIMTKTLLSIQQNLQHEYVAWFRKSKMEAGFACFEVLGFDIMLDQQLNPWLIEVNHSPSLHTDSALDKEVKEAVLVDSLTLAKVYSEDLVSTETQESQNRENQSICVHDQLEKEHENGPLNQKLDTQNAAVDELQRLRKVYEDAHLGGFERLYPLSPTLASPGGRPAFTEIASSSPSRHGRLREQFDVEDRQELYAELLAFQHPLYKERLKVLLFKNELKKRRERRSLEQKLRKNRPHWNTSIRTSPMRRLNKMQDAASLAESEKKVSLTSQLCYSDRLTQGRPTHGLKGGDSVLPSGVYSSRSRRPSSRRSVGQVSGSSRTIKSENKRQLSLPSNLVNLTMDSKASTLRMGTKSIGFQTKVLRRAGRKLASRLVADKESVLMSEMKNLHSRSALRPDTNAWFLRRKQYVEELHSKSARVENQQKAQPPQDLTGKQNHRIIKLISISK